MSGKESLDIHDLERYAPSEQRCIKMIMDAREGEETLEENAGSSESLRTLLFRGSNDPRRDGRAAAGSKIKQTSQKKKKRVGEPLPRRYPTGAKA
jgi:hypothetical protein